MRASFQSQRWRVDQSRVVLEGGKARDSLGLIISCLNFGRHISLLRPKREHARTGGLFLCLCSRFVATRDFVRDRIRSGRRDYQNEREQKDEVSSRQGNEQCGNHDDHEKLALLILSCCCQKK